MFKRPSFRVPPAIDAPREDPIARWIAFTGAPEQALGQGWLTAPEDDFSPGAVRLMWSSDALLVAASLEDEDIISAQSTPDAPAFTAGDAFEIFLRPFATEAYLELHVTPGNAHLALRFPQPGGAGGRPLSEFELDTQCFASVVKVDRIASCWTVAADVPWSLLELEPRPGLELLGSFARYDYTEGREAPVLSSTSPHAECDFHRHQEWAKFVLDAGR